MSSNLHYDGQHLFWFGVGNFKRKHTYKGTSGKKKHQTADEQGVKNKGPIPEGRYSFSIKLAGTAHVVDPDPDNFDLDTKQGIQSLVDMKDDAGETHNSTEWGENRVRLNLVQLFHPKDTGHRSGFYLHDSVKGFTHGCIEVSPAFFKLLRKFAAQEAKKTNGIKTMSLLVKYPSKKASTYGGTDKK